MLLRLILLGLLVQMPIAQAACRIELQEWSGGVDTVADLLSLAARDFNRTSQRLDVE